MSVKRLLLLALLTCPAWAHAGEPIQPHDLLTAWSFSPGIIVPLALSAWLYYRGDKPGRGVRTWEAACFWLGWLTLVVALVSPIHPLGEALFSAHMVQHELLMVIAAPLLVLSRPLVPFLWGFPLAWRRSLGAATTTTWVQRCWNFVTRPVTAWFIHAAALWGWHIPRLFEATLTSDLVHSLQHISFLASALLFWWSLLPEQRTRQASASAFFSLFTTALHTTALGALLTLSTTVWYPAYGTQTATWGLTPIEDQQLGGLIMWVPAGIVYVVVGLALGSTWLRERQCKPALAASVAILAVLLTSSCNRDRQAYDLAKQLTGGDPQRGKMLVSYYGCSSCHTIPGIANAEALVGPPLTKFGQRVYVAGMLPNTPENLVQWIQHPRQVNERTAMPELGVTPQDARDIAGYLYMLR